jgi:Flp pilus assembly protein TadD
MHTLGRTPEAIQWLQAAQGLEPRNAGVHYSLAVYFTAAGRRQEALTAYENVRQIDPQLATQLYHAIFGGR